MTVGLVATFVQWRRAETQRARAEGRFADLRQLANALIFELHDEVKVLAGATRAREAIVRRGGEYLDRLAASSVDPALRAELAAGYLRLGDVQGRRGEASLGDATAAIQSYRKAVRLADELVAPAGATVEQRALLARACARLAEALRELGETKEAEALLGRAVNLLETAVDGGTRQHEPAESPRGPDDSDQGRAHADAGDWSAALEAYGRSAELYQALVVAEPGNPQHRRNVALAHKYMGGVSTVLGRHEESRRHYDAAVSIDRELLRSSPQDPTARMDLSYDVAALAKADQSAGRPGPALAGLREALALRQWVLSADPVNVQARAGVARAHADLAWMLGRSGAWTEAEAEMRRGLVERERLAAPTEGHSGPSAGARQGHGTPRRAARRPRAPGLRRPRGRGVRPAPQERARLRRRSRPAPAEGPRGGSKP